MELAVAHYKKVLLEAISLCLEVAVGGFLELILELQLLGCALAGSAGSQIRFIQILIQLLLLREFALLFFITERGTKLGGLTKYLLLT